MLTVENMGAVLKAYRQDLRDMADGTYVAPTPHISMTYEDESAYLRSSPYIGLCNNKRGINGVMPT